MSQYASLVEDEEIKQNILENILTEYELTQRMVSKILGASLEQNRPIAYQMLEIRKGILETLHQQQIRLLKQWRALSKGKNQAEEYQQTLQSLY